MYLLKQKWGIQTLEIIFDAINNNKVEEKAMLKENGVYIYLFTWDEGMKDEVYLGETGRKFRQRFLEHKRGKNTRNTIWFYAGRFVKKGYKLINTIENYKITKLTSSYITKI